MKRRTNVVGSLPNEAAILAEQHDEWQGGKRYFSTESLALLNPPPTPAVPALLAAD